jgi:biopolymer transport protein ExbD
MTRLFATGLFANSEAQEDAVSSTINTTPLVDVMLVLLIIFLITIPVVTHSVAVNLPKERNVVREVAPQNVQISVDAQGTVFWNGLVVAEKTLKSRLADLAKTRPQPEVHIHGDEAVPYAVVGRIVLACQQAGLIKLHFVTEPPARSGGGR